MAYLNYGLVAGGNGTVSAFSDPSYTVRAFNTFLKEVKVTNFDEQYHTYYQNTGTAWEKSNEYYFSNGSIPTYGTVFVKNQENWVYPQINQGTVNTYTQLTLDQLNQLQLETGIPVSDDAHNNDEGVSIPVNGTVEFDSYYQENLLIEPFDSGTHYLQMAIWDLPGTADSSTLNLANSSISFSSSMTFDPANTVTIPFNSSELEIPIVDAGTADHLWKINRNVLTNQSIPSSGSVDLTSLKRIKFKLVSSGTAAIQFKTGQLKMVPNTYSHNYANVNTKTGVLFRETWPTISQNHMPVLIQDGLTVKNFTYVAKLSFRALPVGGTTEFSMFARIRPEFEYGTVTSSTASPAYPATAIYPSTAFYPSPNESVNAYLKSKVLIDENSAQIILYENYRENQNNQVFNISYDSPLTDGEYFFVTKLHDNKWESILYSSQQGGDFADNIVLETGQQVINNSWLAGDNISPYDEEVGKGYAGYQFKPSEKGGFSLDYIYSKNAVLAEYESKTFNSYSPVSAVSIFPNSVPDTNLLSREITDFVRVTGTNNFNFSGKTEVGVIATPQNANLDDVLVEEDTNIIFLNKSIKITKKEDAKIAAVQYKNKLKINDFSKLILKLKLRFNDLLNTGEFRAVFWNEDRTKVIYIEPLRNIVPNEWNEIDIPLYTNLLYNNQFILEIGHYGQIDPIPPITDPYGYFWLEDVELTLESVEWEASNNDGRTYVPFLDAVNGEYKSINFASQNYYTSIINKNPYILWEFNDLDNVTGSNSIVLGVDNRNKIAGQFITTAAGANLNDYIISTPGSVAGSVTVGGTAYPIPASVQKIYNNRAIAIYGGTDSYLQTANSETLANVFGIGLGSASDITASIRFYTDTTSNKITLLSCEDSLGTVTNSWNLSINNGNDLIFESNGVGTITATVPTWDDQKWHSACFAYSTVDNGLRLYWDGELVSKETLATDLIFNYSLKCTGPTATVPHNSYNSFNPNLPFLFVDNISIHKTLLDQNEIYKDYIAAISSYNQLKVRARAYTTNAWLVGYELIPYYAKMGRLKENVNKAITKTDSFTATEYSPYGDGIIFDQAIFDVSTFGND